LGGYVKRGFPRFGVCSWLTHGGFKKGGVHLGKFLPKVIRGYHGVDRFVGMEELCELLPFRAKWGLCDNTGAI